jgi:anti-sigma regulatory factor (Ser/Thr protein kinase)
MPTRTQSDFTMVGHMMVGHAFSAHELEMSWGDFADDQFNGDPPPPDLSAVRAKRICHAVEFDAARDSPGEARRKVVRELRGRGYDDALIQDAALLVTELASNAVVHAGSSFSVSVSLRDSMLRIDVADSGRVAASRASQEWVPRQGHGLGLIDAICVRWGSDTVPEGKVVWGELQL